MKRTATIIKELTARGLHPIRHDGQPEGHVCLVSCEHGDANTSDYYGEYRGGYPHIDEWIAKYAKDNDLLVEWQNPGALCLTRN